MHSTPHHKPLIPTLLPVYPWLGGMEEMDEMGAAGGMVKTIGRS